MRRLLRRLVLILPAFLPVGLSCGYERPLSRPEYIEIWMISALRSREKGTDPADEMEEILDQRGISREAYESAEEAWFGTDTLEAIRRGIRSALETPGFMPRSTYVRTRVQAYLRSKIRKTEFLFEISCLSERRGFMPGDFHAAERLWIGDGDTTEQLHALYEDLLPATSIPWEAWTELSGSEQWGKDGWEEWLLGELHERKISREGWRAMEDLFFISRADFVRFSVLVSLRAELLDTSPEAERAKLAGRQGFTLEAFRAASRIWGDEETGSEERKLRARLAPALKVPLESYREIKRLLPDLDASQAREWLDGELRRRGIALADFEALSDVLR